MGRRRISDILHTSELIKIVLPLQNTNELHRFTLNNQLFFSSRGRMVMIAIKTRNELL